MERLLLLPSVPESVPRAVRFAESVAEEAGLPGPLTDRLMLVAGEAVSNAITHGNRLDPLRHVRLAWRSDGGGGWLSVEDERKALTAADFDDPQLPDDAMQTSGRGLYIMAALADEIVVEDGVLALRFVERADEQA